MYVTRRALNLRARVNNATWHRRGTYCWTEGKYERNCNFTDARLMKQCCSDVATLRSVSTRAIVLVRSSIAATTLIPSLSERNIRSGILLLSGVRIKRANSRDANLSADRSFRNKRSKIKRIISRDKETGADGWRRGGGGGVWRTRLEFQNGLVDD